MGHFGMSAASTAKVTPPAAHLRLVVGWQQSTPRAFMRLVYGAMALTGE